MKKNKLVKITTRLDDCSSSYEIETHGDYVYFRSYIDEEHPTRETEMPLRTFIHLLSELNLIYDEQRT